MSTVSAGKPWRGVAGFIVLLFAFVLLPFFLLESHSVEVSARLLDDAHSARLVFVLVVAGLALDVFLPLPSTLIAATASVVLGGSGAFLSVWLGLTLGCVLGYEFGATAGQAALKRLVSDAQRRRFQWLHGKLGWAALVICRPIPVLAEVSVLLAGSAAVPRRWVYPLVTGTNVLVALLYVFFGDGVTASAA